MLARRAGLEVIYWDERLTTVAADRSMMGLGIRRGEIARSLLMRLRRFLFCRDIWIICQMFGLSFYAEN